MESLWNLTSADICEAKGGIKCTNNLMPTLGKQGNQEPKRTNRNVTLLCVGKKQGGKGLSVQ
jgi:hypothetical protein